MYCDITALYSTLSFFLALRCFAYDTHTRFLDNHGRATWPGGCPGRQQYPGHLRRTDGGGQRPGGSPAVQRPCARFACSFVRPAIAGVPSQHAGHFGRRKNSCSDRSEEHTSELQSLMRISYAVFCLKKKNNEKTNIMNHRNTNRV